MRAACARAACGSLMCVCVRLECMCMVKEGPMVLLMVLSVGNWPGSTRCA